MNPRRIFICLFFAGFFSSHSAAEVAVSPRHIVILHTALDEIWGNYIFAVENTSSAPMRQTLRVMFPQETTDWRPEEGVSPEEVRLGDDGGVVIDKEFAQGTNLIFMAFLVKSNYGEADLSFVPTSPVAELSILTSPGELTMSAPGAIFSPDIEFTGQRFDKIALSNLPVGEKLVVKVSGVPEGRTKWWIAGTAVGSLLFIVGFIFAFTTRPKEDEAVML